MFPLDIDELVDAWSRQDMEETAKVKEEDREEAVTTETDRIDLL